MEKMTQKALRDIEALKTEVATLNEKFLQFVTDSQNEHDRIKHDSNVLIQQQRDVIQHLTEELERERKDRRIRRARAIARFKSE